MNPHVRSFTALCCTALYALTSVTVGCSSNKTPPANSTQNTPAAQPAEQSISIDDLVAPIALYPDQLLGQVLALSVNPQEVLDIGNWLIQNQNLQGDALTQAVKTAGFSPPAQYLAHFPQVVDNMCQEMDWTKQLGEAFKSDQKSVMAAIQRKRTQAQQMGNLQSSPQMTVDTKSDNGQQYVEIKPADPKVVYVPQYNPVTIYNTQAPAAPATTAPATTATTTSTTTTTEQKSGVSTGTAVAIGLLSFGVGMAVGSAIHHDDYYYPYPAWGYGGVYYGGRPYYPPPYRPPVYPGYRPVYGYNPPATYRWNQYNRQTNVTINNNYYGRFNNTNVNRPANLPANNTGYLGANNNNRPGANQNNARGQSTYLGERQHPANERPGAGMATAVPRSEQLGGTRANAPNQAGNFNRPATQQAGNRGGVMASNAGGMNRPGAGGTGTARPATMPSNQPMNRGGDRGYGSASRPNTPTAAAPSARPASNPSARPTPSPQPSNRGGAFGGGSAAGDRAASNRGRASMGASHGHAGGGRRR